MTNINIRRNKGVSQCRSCKKVFKHKDLKVIQIKRYGVPIEEKVCPYCLGHTYGVIDYPIDEKELIYKNRKFYIGKTRYNNTY